MTMDTPVLSEFGQKCLQSLLRIWFEFERDLNKVAIIQRLQQNRLSLEDYQRLLLNLRQQVIEGSRWISRSASSFDRDFSDVRSMVIGHARDEHKDYHMLEQDYVATGGKLHDIQNATRNIGTEALHGFLMYRASQNNPVDLIGAMWIIEGLGNKMAEDWSACIDQTIGSQKPITQFMQYHADNDSEHLEKLYGLIDRVCKTDNDLIAIERTAKVVARLYCLQLEEVDKHVSS